MPYACRYDPKEDRKQRAKLSDDLHKQAWAQKHAAASGNPVAGLAVGYMGNKAEKQAAAGRAASGRDATVGRGKQRGPLLPPPRER